MIGKIQIMQAEVVFSEGDQPLLLHAAQFMGQGAAVDAQKGRQFLPGVGDGKSGCLTPGGLHGQVGRDALPQAVLGENRQTVFLLVEIHAASRWESASRSFSSSNPGWVTNSAGK